MRLNEALSQINRCTIPDLQEDTELKILGEIGFFYPAPVNQTQCDVDSRFILFSAPGAVGKTTLARYIASTYGGLYWDLSSKPIGDTSFAGEITHAVGIGNGSRSDEIFKNLKCGKALFVLDAFDEAILISRREGIKNFIIEIGKILDGAEAPSVILTARTETAEFIRSICKERGFGLTSYDIDYFDEEDAPLFIKQYLCHAGIEVSPAIEVQIQEYLGMIKQRIDNTDDTRHFIGYAQVLSILARQVEEELRSASSLVSLYQNSSISKSNTLIYDIIQELLTRETSKLEAFKRKIKSKYLECGKQNVVDGLYGKSEQLTRLQFYILAGNDISIDDYYPSLELFKEDQDEYLRLLQEWLPQHVFLLKGNVMPIFHDYLLAESLLNSELELFVDEYKTKLPTRVFLDCYLALTGGNVYSKHVYYVDMAYSSQATTGDKAYCEIGPSNDGIDEGDQKALALFLTLTSKQNNGEPSITARIIQEMNDPILLNRAECISVNVSGKVVLEQSFLNEVIIRQASIECDELELRAQDVVFEGYNNEESMIMVRQKASRAPTTKIVIRGTPELKIDFPNTDIMSYRKMFHELHQYFYSFDSDMDRENGDSKPDFDYAIKKVLEQFTIDNYGGDPAKHREKIDARCHTGCKAKVLAFLKDMGVIYEDGILYKASMKRMEDYRISRVAYTHQHEQLQFAYEEYRKWLSRG